MTQDWTDFARGRTFLFPLMVALPIFFALYTLMVGLWVVSVVEHGWNSGMGSVWQSLVAARHWTWWLAAGGAGCGLAWAWVILLPVRNYRYQLERLAEEGKAGTLEIDSQSELSYLALSFNRVMDEVTRNLPERVHTILQSISSGVLLIDGQGCLESVNPQAARMLESAPKRLEGLNYREALSRSEELVGLVQEALLTQADYPQRVIQITDRNGGSRRIGVWLAWVRNSDQQPVSLSLTLVDLKKIDRFASGLATAERMSLLSNVGRGMAHEIRNPLASIRGLSQLLSEKKDVSPEKIESYTRVMMEEVDRVNRVVDRLSLIVSAHSEEAESILVSDLLVSSLEMTAHLARSKWVTLEMGPVEESATVTGIRQLLVQAISNVVVNGIEAAPEYGRVRLAAHSDRPGWIVLTIENDGPPIHPAEFDDIFQPFHTTKDNASGLGMTITDSIIRDHGGVIEVRSASDGTIFSILLPTLRPGDRSDSDSELEVDPEISAWEAALIGFRDPNPQKRPDNGQSNFLTGERFTNERD